MTLEEKRAAVKDWMRKAELDPTIIKETLGVEYKNLDPKLLLEASKKLIKLNRKEAEPDHRDNLAYATFHGVEDFVKEHIEKDAGKYQAKAKMKMQQKKDLSWLHSGFFTPQVKSVVIGNSLSENIEGHNLLSNYDIAHKVTKLGEGGIPKVDSLPDESRQIHPSYFGFFDPFRVSESLTVGADHRVAHNVVKGKDNKLYRLVLDKQNKPKWIDHETFVRSKVELPEY